MPAATENFPGEHMSTHSDAELNSVRFDHFPAGQGNAVGLKVAPAGQ